LQQYISTKVLSDLLAGGFAGFCSVMANNPVDVIKTKMQGVDAQRYAGFLDCGK
jgi:solute carrier family 25 citrate transporter 1